MIKSWIGFVLAVLVLHFFLFIFLLYFDYGKLPLFLTVTSLVVCVAILSFNAFARVTSPYALAAMFVEDLKKRKFGPPITKVEEPDANHLMNALNELAGELKFQHENMEKLENLRVEFVANVSHELKTPLTSIRGYTETLLNGGLKDPEAASRFLKRIDENSEKLSALISDLLELSRLETFPDEIDWSVFSSSAIAEKLEAVFFPTLSQSKQKMFIKFMDTQIQGDRKKLEQVFYNLIDNAIRYTPAGTLIELKERREGSDFIYEVSDNGPGIAKEHLPRIFERFYRVDSDRNRETGGTGLGLAIVKHIVLDHGGSINVESSLGLGTKFTIRIPARSL